MNRIIVFDVTAMVQVVQVVQVRLVTCNSVWEDQRHLCAASHMQSSLPAVSHHISIE